MIYTVTWRPVAENCLAELWTPSEDKGDIAKAADEIDYRLRHDPHNQGETRTKDAVRIVVEEPVSGTF